MRLFIIVHTLSVIILVKNLQADNIADINAERYTNYVHLLRNCSKENGITAQMYGYASKTNNTNGTYDKSKCVDACMFKALKIMKPDGTIDIEKAVEHLLSGEPGVQRDIMRTNIERCSLKKEDTDCDTAHNLMSCALGYY